jgi:spore coat protein U-like protein
MRARIGAAFLALAFSASADQASMDVGAELVGTCKVSSVTPIDFGDLEQSAASPNRLAHGNLVYWCSKGFRYTVTTDNGLHSSKGTRRMKGQAATNSLEYLSYDLRPRGKEKGTGLGPQYPEVFEMEAEVKGENYDPLSVGPLRDTIVVTISP